MPAPKPPAPLTLPHTRLAPPRMGPRVIAREALLAQLMAARRLRCIALQGPAGCGKTTAVAAWRQAVMPLGFGVAWLGLAPEDNDPAQFLDGLLASLGSLHPTLTQDAAELAHYGADADTQERATVALVRAMAQHAGDLVLVLDDVHLLTEPRVHHMLQWLLDYAPPNFHLALISRSTPPVSLARLRAQQQTLELDLRELRFSPDESARFLRAHLGNAGSISAISPQEAQDWHERCDGWVAGLQLLVIARKQTAPRRSAAGSPAASPMAASAASATAAAASPSPASSTWRASAANTQLHDAPAFAAFFEREVLAQLSPSELGLLISASACSRFNAGLCAALIDKPSADAEVLRLLHRLEANSLFISPVEGERDSWWRLHPLLRETLSQRLARRSAAHQQHVHRVAWHWFRDQGLLAEAVHHAVRAGEAEAAADCVAQHARRLADAGELRGLIGLVRHLPPAQVQARHDLRLWLLRAELYARRFDVCQQAIAQLRQDLPADDHANRFSLNLVHTMLAMQRDDLQTASALIDTLAELPDASDAMAVGGRANILSWLLLNRSEFEAARQAQANATPRLLHGQPHWGTASGLLQGRCLIGLSHMLQGRVAEAEHGYREVLQLAAQGGSACHDPHNLATVLLAEVLAEQNEPQAVLDLLQERVDLLERVSIPDAVLRLLGALAAAHRTLGHELESLSHLERLEEHASQHQLPRLLAHSLAGQLRHHLQLGQRSQAEPLMQRLSALASLSDEAPWPSDPQALRDGRTAVGWPVACARVAWLLAEGQHAAAHRANDALIAHAQRTQREGLWVQRVLTRVAITLAEPISAQLSTAEREARIAQDLNTALRTAHRLGLLRSVLDAGAPVLAAIHAHVAHVRADPVLAFYADRLRAAEAQWANRTSATQPAPASATGAGALDALSEREREVIALLAQALPNKKIARTLGLSPETIKWHLKNIYGKLGVVTRDEAVARVRDLRWQHDTEI